MPCNLIERKYSKNGGVAMRLFNLVGGMVGLYRIVPANEAHVRIMFDKKELVMSRDAGVKPGAEAGGKPNRPSYWVVPFVTRVHKLPLTNIRIDVPDVKLNDKNMAKFLCDIVCFVNIKDPLLAAERTDITITEKRYEDPAIKMLSADFQAIMESIGRTTATKQSILDIYMDRTNLDNAVTAEVEKVFPQWGLQLVDLEIKDLKDVSESTIIADIERKIAAQINADARVKVAEETRRAEVVEAEQKRASRFRQAEMEEEARKREIAKDREVAIAEQEREKMEAKKTTEANAEKVEAKRKIEVGFADVDRESTVKRAEGTKSKLEIEAKGIAAKTFTEGEAEAKIVKLKKVAEAEGIERLAEAQKQFDEAATRIQFINANKEVGMEYAKAYQQLINSSTINIVAGSTQEVMSGGLLGNVRLGPKEGVALGQFLDANPDFVNELLKRYLPSPAPDDKSKRK